MRGGEFRNWFSPYQIKRWPLDYTRLAPSTRKSKRKHPWGETCQRWRYFKVALVILWQELLLPLRLWEYRSCQRRRSLEPSFGTDSQIRTHNCKFRAKESSKEACLIIRTRLTNRSQRTKDLSSPTPTAAGLFSDKAALGLSGWQSEFTSRNTNKKTCWKQSKRS